MRRFDASLGWGLGDTELDLVGMFDLGTEPGPSASGPPQGVASGYETPSIDWLRLLGSAREPSTSSAAAAAATTTTAATAGATADARADVPSVSSTAADASVDSTGAQVPPPFVHPAVPPARTPRSDPIAGISPQTALSTAEELSLATPSDGGGPEAPSITPWPHVYQPVAPVGPLSLPTVPNPPPPLVFEQPGATVTSQIREAMIELVQNSHISPWSGISLASFPSASVLSICLKLYLSRFHATVSALSTALSCSVCSCSRLAVSYPRPRRPRVGLVLPAPLAIVRCGRRHVPRRFRRPRRRANGACPSYDTVDGTPISLSTLCRKAR